MAVNNTRYATCDAIDPTRKMEGDYASSVTRDPGLVMARSSLERLSTE